MAHGLQLRVVSGTFPVNWNMPHKYSQLGSSPWEQDADSSAENALLLTGFKFSDHTAKFKTKVENVTQTSPARQVTHSHALSLREGPKAPFAHRLPDEASFLPRGPTRWHWGRPGCDTPAQETLGVTLPKCRAGTGPCRDLGGSDSLLLCRKRPAGIGEGSIRQERAGAVLKVISVGYTSLS